VAITGNIGGMERNNGVGIVNKLICGNSLIELGGMGDSSIDAIVCDPPYELGFMGKKWDSSGVAYNIGLWRECLRVLKPGGHLLAFGGTRTYHRMACAIEDAGFEVRDMLEWVYSSGFPKSLNIGKAVDKLQGNEREVVGENPNYRPVSGKKGYLGESNFRQTDGMAISTKGNSAWEGFGTALKPAHEPVIMARKPLSEDTIVGNVLKHGTGALDIDGCRIPTGDVNKVPQAKGGTGDIYGFKNGEGRSGEYYESHTQGRFPANIICSDDALNDGVMTKSTNNVRKNKVPTGEKGIYNKYEAQDSYGHADSGSKSRYFDIDVWAEKHGILQFPKASKRERNERLDSYVTVKYNIPKTGGILCKEESMVAVQLLQKVIFAQEPVNFNTDESGENITVQCHKDFLSTISTETKRIIESKIYSLLMHSLTSESTQDANSETENGGNLAENVAKLRRLILTTTKGNRGLAHGASLVVCEMLQTISEEGNWKQACNIHSTVKPISVMAWLIRLVSKEGDTVLDPFMGSGTTGVACKNLNRNFVGIELNAEYHKIAESRISGGLPVERTVEPTKLPIVIAEGKQLELGL